MSRPNNGNVLLSSNCDDTDHGLISIVCACVIARVFRREEETCAVDPKRQRDRERRGDDLQKVEVRDDERAW